MRRELETRGLDWPADVLQATAGATDFELVLKVVVEGADELGARPLNEGTQPANTASGTDR
jgi:hypothetical protein